MNQIIPIYLVTLKIILILCLPVVRPHMIGSYFNECNTIDNQNRMQKSDIELQKYWVTQSGYFRLATTVALSMGITYGKIPFCNGISEGSEDNKISLRKYSPRAVYDCFNHPFTDHCVGPNLNPPPITIYDIPLSDKRSRYTPDLLPADIPVYFEKYGITLTTPSDLTHSLVLTYTDPNPHHP